MNDFIKEKIVMDGLTYDDVLLIQIGRAHV